MPRPEPIAILIVSDQADDIKRLTQTLRGFFGDCRIEPVYSPAEALQWAHRADWHLILLESHLGLQGQPPLLSDLKHRLPTTTLVLLAGQPDVPTAARALETGADFLVHKHSPAFLTEVVLYAKDTVAARALRARFSHIQDRHLRLLETLTDVVYELDAEGRFVYLSPAVTDLLGHSPEDLTGTPCTALIPPDQWDRARHRINDRRSGPRAARRVVLELLSKALPGQATAPRVLAEISATGLYDAQQRYVGSLGVMRNVSQQVTQSRTIESLHSALQDADHLLSLAQQLTGLSNNLQTPLAAVLTQSQQLLETIREVQLDTKLESLALCATEAAQRGEELALSVQHVTRPRETFLTLLDEALATYVPSLADSGLIDRTDAPQLPPYAGPKDQGVRIIHLLLTLALRHMAAAGAIHQLHVRTVGLDESGARLPHDQPPPPNRPVATVEVQIEETTRPIPFAIDSLTAPTDLAITYALLRPLGGRLDIFAPAESTLILRLRLPVSIPETAPPPSAPVSPAPLPAPRPASPAMSAPQSLPQPSVSPLPDRRAAARVSVHLAALVTLGNVTRRGTLEWISATGAAIALQGPFPHLDHQPAYLVFKTDVGILELHALASTREWPQEASPAPVPVLALQFAPTGETEQGLLASFVSAAGDRSLSFTLEALLAPPDEDDSTPASSPSPLLEQRDTPRVRVALPIHLETARPGPSTTLAFGSAVNFSRGGLCLLMKQSPGPVGTVVRLHFPHTGMQGQPRTHEPASPDTVLPARIIWHTPTVPTPSTVPLDRPEPDQRIGLQFVDLTPFMEREINRVVAQHLLSPMDFDGMLAPLPVVSTQRECRNPRGQLLAMTDDHARHHVAASTPIVILSPGFGCTQTDYLPLAEFLAVNRVRVLRYDHSNHVGRSEGDSLQTTLCGMQADLQTVLAFAHTTWPAAPLVLVAEDLAARVALKAAVQTPALTHVLLVNPVLDVPAAITDDAGRDLLAAYRQGARTGPATLWGLNVHLDHFLGDLLAGGYQGASSSSEDLAAVAARVTFLSTPHTDRTPAHQFPSYSAALRTLAPSPTVVQLPAPLFVPSLPMPERHQKAFTLLFREIARVLFPNTAQDVVQQPTDRQIHHQRQLEEERLRIRRAVSRATREALWHAHVEHLPQLNRLHAYSWLLQELYQHSLPLDPGTMLLEVGCGLGDLARVIGLNHAYHVAHQAGAPRMPLRYIGLDRHAETLTSANEALSRLHQDLSRTLPQRFAETPAMQTEWLAADWPLAWPIHEHTVDCVFANLAISFTVSPHAFLRQAAAALRPGGRLILTCFQPHTDLTALSHEELLQTAQPADEATRQILFHHLGRLHEAVRHGLLHAFDQERLSAALRATGFDPLRIVPVLNGHVLLAIAQNRD